MKKEEIEKKIEALQKEVSKKGFDENMKTTIDAMRNASLTLLVNERYKLEGYKLCEEELLNSIHSPKEQDDTVSEVHVAKYGSSPEDIKTFIRKFFKKNSCTICGKALNKRGRPNNPKSLFCSGCYNDAKNGMHGNMRKNLIKKFDKLAEEILKIKVEDLEK